jgi:hypothetical protein
MKPHFEFMLPQLIGPLYRGGELFWNPTVNKMSALVLQRLLEENRSLFLHHAAFVIDGAQPSADEDRSSPVIARHQSSRQAASSRDTKSPGHSPLSFPRPVGVPAKAQAKLNAAAVWRPGQGPPPVTVTGVAPWAVHAATGASVAPAKGPETSGGIHKPRLPPSLLGGSGGVLRSHSSEGKLESNSKAKETDSISHRHHQGAGEPARGEGSTHSGSPSERSTRESLPTRRSEEEILVVLSAYINKCKGITSADGHNGVAEVNWIDAQTAGVPTLLPDLKFHELVFGRELGRGAFSVVKYARHLQ